MTKWTKPELENLLEDVVNELDFSDGMINKHGQLGTAPAELVRLVLERKDSEIAMLKRGFVSIEAAEAKLKSIDELLGELIGEGEVEALGAELKAAEAKLEKTSELISLYFEGCDCDEFDDRVRELRAAMEE